MTLLYERPTVRNPCLTISRFAMSAWVGAACLFVVTTLLEVRSPKLDSITKAELAVLRFPVYYLFAFSLISTALVFGMCSLRSMSPRRRSFAMSFVLTALVLTVADYIWIYKPLEAMTAIVDQSRPAEFVSYHKASKWINSLQITVSLAAAIAICWPMAQRADTS